MGKMGQKMIGLCSAAIGAVYLAGYYVSEPSNQIQSKESNTINKLAVVSPNKMDIPKQQISKMYKNGTFKGEGYNRIGSVEVAVTIKNDRITNVEITRCTTSYSESFIQDLPKQVIVRQSPNVDVVSGATRSTEDFQNAVEEALQQAKI